MPVIVSCSDCAKKLRVPDNLLGKKVRCPGCGNMFTASADGQADDEAARSATDVEDRAEAIADRRPVAAPAREGEDEDSRQRRRGGAPARGGDEHEDRSRRRREEDDRDDRRSRREEDDRIARREEDDRRDRRDEDDRRDRRREEDDRRDRRDEGAPSKAEQERAGWRKVRLGLTLVIFGAIAYLAFHGAMLLGGGIFMLTGVALLDSLFSGGISGGQALGGAVAMGIGLMVFLSVMGLFRLAETGLRLTGMGICLAVPNRKDSFANKGLIIAAFACAATYALLQAAQLAWSAHAMGSFGALLVLVSGGYGWLGYAGHVLGIAWLIVFLIFVRSVCVTLKDKEAAKTVMAVLIAWAVWYGLTAIVGMVAVCGGVAAGASAMTSRTAGGAATSIGTYAVIIGILVTITYLGMLGLHVWYVLVLVRVRNLVEQHLGRAE